MSGSNYAVVRPCVLSPIRHFVSITLSFSYPSLYTLCYPSVCMSDRLSVCFYIRSSFPQLICLSDFLYVFSVILFVSSSVRPFIYLSIRLPSVRYSIRPSVRTFFSLQSHPSLHISARPLVCLPVYLFFHSSVYPSV